MAGVGLLFGPLAGAGPPVLALLRTVSVTRSQASRRLQGMGTERGLAGRGQPGRAAAMAMTAWVCSAGNRNGLHVQQGWWARHGHRAVRATTGWTRDRKACDSLDARQQWQPRRLAARPRTAWTYGSKGGDGLAAHQQWLGQLGCTATMAGTAWTACTAVMAGMPGWTAPRARTARTYGSKGVDSLAARQQWQPERTAARARIACTHSRGARAQPGCALAEALVVAAWLRRAMSPVWTAWQSPLQQCRRKGPGIFSCKRRIVRAVQLRRMRKADYP